MPLVRIVHDGHSLPKSDRLEQIRKEIKAIVAEELSCDDEGGSLKPEHVEVEMSVSRPGDSIHDEFAVMLFIDANDFHSRRANIQERSDSIALRVKNILGMNPLHGFVWVRLFPAGFTEF